MADERRSPVSKLKRKRPSKEDSSPGRHNTIQVGWDPEMMADQDALGSFGGL
jgi:hypothetical protein